MSQGKPRKGYLLKCAREEHKPLDKYQNTDILLAEFLSSRLEYSPEMIGSLIEEFRKKQGGKGK